jgi:hypothetical protein
MNFRLFSYWRPWSQLRRPLPANPPPDVHAAKRRHMRLEGIALCAGPVLASAARTQVPWAVVFRNVTVVPMDFERVLAAQTVIVRGSTIESVPPTATNRLPAGAIVIDATGRFLMPGLRDMHVHLPGPAAPIVGCANASTPANYLGRRCSWLDSASMASVSRVPRTVCGQSDKRRRWGTISSRSSPA